MVGVTIGPTGILAEYMHNLPSLPTAEHSAHHWWVVIASGGLAIVGVMVGLASASQAWTFRSAGSLGKSLSSAGKNRFYIDEILQIEKAHRKVRRRVVASVVGDVEREHVFAATGRGKHRRRNYRRRHRCRLHQDRC